MELNSEWLSQLEKEDLKYSKFYRETVNEIDIYCLYIDQNNDLKFGKKQKYQIANKSISKDDLVHLIKTNIKYSSIKYKPFSIFKYNFTLEPLEIKNYLDNPANYTFITTEQIANITFNDTINFFKKLNSLYILYYEPHTLKNTDKTKKIFINNKKLNQKRKTKKKQLKV